MAPSPSIEVKRHYADYYRELVRNIEGSPAKKEVIFWTEVKVGIDISCSSALLPSKTAKLALASLQDALTTFLVALSQPSPRIDAYKDRVYQTRTAFVTIGDLLPSVDRVTYHKFRPATQSILAMHSI